MEITEILVKFVFTEILVQFMTSIFGNEILVELIFGQKMIIFGHDWNILNWSEFYKYIEITEILVISNEINNLAS